MQQREKLLDDLTAKGFDYSIKSGKELDEEFKQSQKDPHYPLRYHILKHLVEEDERIERIIQ